MSALIKEYEPLLKETEKPVDLVEISERDGILFNNRFCQDRRLRQVLYQKIIAARQFLPSGLTFMIYEAYRPRHRQVELWERVQKQYRAENPFISQVDLDALCHRFVSNPYKTGSGHQFGCAIDITLYNVDEGCELDMGTPIQSFESAIQTDSPLVTKAQQDNRFMMRDALEREGLVNYPEEWWHYSYGDRLWAILTSQEETLYSPLQL